VDGASENARELVLFSDWIKSIVNLSYNATKICYKRCSSKRLEGDGINEWVVGFFLEHWITQESRWTKRWMSSSACFPYQSLTGSRLLKLKLSVPSSCHQDKIDILWREILVGRFRWDTSNSSQYQILPALCTRLAHRFLVRNRLVFTVVPSKTKIVTI